MTSSESLIRAAFNRLKARMGNSLLSSISKTEVLLKKGPDLIQKEWNILKEEIIDEAYRIDEEEREEGSLKDIPLEKENSSNSQNRVDQLREKVSKLTKHLEAIN